MLIHSITLNNIRSYTNQTIEFEEGITLLAGDIGSGKSTILLAIEFALFGIRRGDISGDGLLRHGEKEGSVTLTFTTDKTYTVHRQLKRSSQGVRQDAGYLSVNDQKESLTANELKARILEIIGYPEQLLSKTKGFVFRYTVYTPQEEMKQILYESDTNRLDTLRSVFGVDRYQLIQENANMLAKQLRDDKRFLAQQLSDEEELKEKQHLLKEQLTKATEQLQEVRDQSKTAQDTLKAAEKHVETLRASFEKEHQRQKQYSALTGKQEALQRQIAALSQRITHQHSLLAQKREPVENPEGKREELAERITALKEKRAQVRAKLSTNAERQQSLSDQLARVQELTSCPVCQQDVNTQHKDHIKEDVDAELASLQEKHGALTRIQNQLNEAITSLEEKQQSLSQRKRMFEQYQEFLAAQKSAQEQLETLTKEETTLKQQLKDVEQERSRIAEPLADAQALKDAESAFRTAQQKYQSILTTQATLTERKEQFATRLDEHDERISALKNVKQELTSLTQKERWLTQGFVPTVAVMEKHVLAAIHQEFSRLFTKWCQALLDDEHIFATLSPNFAPEVTVHGYDADVTHLSGGEKTSLALAYRLALNVVVNEFMRSLKTTDLLILDEPTDGFSSEQLDRVRDVLQELSLRQVIMVSHEQKMQSYVDRVITVHRYEGASSIR